MGALASAVRQGKALYVGISNYDPEQTRAAAAALAGRGRAAAHPPAAVHMFDRHIEDGLLPRARRGRRGEHRVLAARPGPADRPLPLGRRPGRLARGDEPLPLARGATSPSYLERVRGLDEIAKERGQTLAQLALSWVLREPLVTSALIGASSVAQLEQNVAALDARAAHRRRDRRASSRFAVHGTGARLTWAISSRSLAALLFGANGSVTKVIIEAGLTPAQLTFSSACSRPAVIAGVWLADRQSRARSGCRDASSP